MTDFLGNEPILEDYWRGIILYGQNVACYKFALGKALLEIGLLSKTFVNRRKDVTSCRDSIAGYQKGKCFYCYRNISIQSGSEDLADVDHFFPHMLASKKLSVNFDGLWNLVLACKECNRGQNGKFEQLPDRDYLKRLYKRNEFFCGSTHPLRDSVKEHAGKTEPERRKFLSSLYDWAKTGPLVNSNWQPILEYGTGF